MASNASRVDQYLHAVAAMGVPEAVSDFFAPDVIFHEFPNRIVPRGRVSRFADLGAAYEQGRKILKSQEYEVQRVVEAGDEVAVELEWRGILAVSGDDLPAGSEMKGFSRSVTEKSSRSETTTAIHLSVSNPAPGLVLGYSRMNEKEILRGHPAVERSVWLSVYASRKR